MSYFRYDGGLGMNYISTKDTPQAIWLLPQAYFIVIFHQMVILQLKSAEDLRFFTY